MLTIAEELFLLMLDDTTGLPHGSINHNVPYALAGGTLADLLFERAVEMDAKRRLMITKTEVPQSALLAKAHKLLQDENKLYKLERWVDLLAARKIARAVPESLVGKGFLEEERKHYLWAQPFVPYPDAGASAKVWIKRDLRDGVLANAAIKPQRLALLALVRGARMLSLVFTKDERAAASRQMDSLIRGDTGAAGEIIPALESAVSAVVAAAVLGG